MGLVVVCWVMFFGALLKAKGAQEHDCDCYEFGTEQTALSVSIYDSKTCECKCKPYVEGKRCDRCKPGFYNIKTQRGCEPCLCDVNGSQNQRCDAATGQCTCREGFFGYRCDACKPFHYRKSQKQCAKCNCNIFGSEDLQCDGFGRCPCHDNVEGKHCDRCKHFTHNIIEHCPECPVCYQQKVNESLRLLQNDLRTVRSQIENLDSIEYEDTEQFADKLGEIQAKALAARDLMRKAKSPGKKLLSELKKKGKNLNNEVKTMLLKMQGSSDLDKFIGTKIRGAEKGARKIPVLIKSAEALLLQAANNKSKHDNAMEDLANKSVEVSSNMTTHLKNLLHLQDQLNKTCASACKVIAKYAEEDFYQELKGLKANMLTTEKEIVKDLRRKVGLVQNTTRQCLAQNEKNALKLDSLKFPDLVNSPDGKLLQSFEKKTRNLIAELDLFGEYAGVVSNMPDQANDQLNTFNKTSKDSLKKIQELDGRTDNFLEEINSLVDKYANISDYNKTLEKNKAEMNLKLKDVPKIQDKINDLVAKIKVQNESLRESRFKVNQSHTKLNADLDKIKDLQQSISLAKANLSETEANLSKLLRDMNLTPFYLTARLSDVRYWRKQVEEEAQNLRERAKELLEIKEDLSRETEAAVENMKKNIQILTEIIEYLNVLPTTKEEFALIEEELRTTEDILRLREEIEVLKKEVNHVKEIADSLPRVLCPKRIGLELKNVL